MERTEYTRIVTLLDFAEEARILHYKVATSTNNAIAFYESEQYKRTSALFLDAIGRAYPDLDKDEIYDVWVDCNESVKYCANIVQDAKEYKEGVRAYCIKNHKHCNSDDCYLPYQLYDEDSLNASDTTPEKG